jgi:hypothetical protein
MKITSSLLVGLLGLSLVGCADMAQNKINKTMTAEDYKTPKNYKTILPAEIKSSLKDPYSSQITLYSGPKFTSFRPGFLADYYGYGVCYSVNAKNSYGGYVGEKLFMFLMDGDKIVWYDNQSMDVSIKNSNISRFCNNLK